MHELCVFKHVERAIITHESTFHMAYITRVIPHTRQFHICARYIFPVLPTCESILVIQFYKNNGTSAIVARKPILHHVISNVCWLLVRLTLIK